MRRAFSKPSNYVAITQTHAKLRHHDSKNIHLTLQKQLVKLRAKQYK